MYRYSYYYYIVLYIILSFNYSSSIDSNLSKRFIIKYFNNEDCTGDITLIRTLLDSANYCFNFPIPFRLQILSNEGLIRLSNCKNCSINDDNCGFNLMVNQCSNGIKLYYEQLNYYEGDYCIATETDNLSKDIFDYKLKGFSAYRKDMVVNQLQVIVKCDYYIFNISHSTLPYYIKFNNVYPSVGQSAIGDLYVMATQDSDFLSKRIYNKQLNNYWEDYFKNHYNNNN